MRTCYDNVLVVGLPVIHFAVESPDVSTHERIPACENEMERGVAEIVHKRQERVGERDGKC